MTFKNFVACDVVTNRRYPKGEDEVFTLEVGSSEYTEFLHTYAAPRFQVTEVDANGSVIP